MKTSNKNLLIAASIACFFIAMPLKAQEYLFGPLNPPPKESTITFTGTANDGQIGRTGGKTFTYTNISLANSTVVYWTILAGEVNLSMNNNSYDGAEVLTFNATLSDLAAGTLVWSGATTIPIANDNGIGIKTYLPLQSRFILTVSDQFGTALSLIEPSGTGLDVQTGAALLITGNTMTFKTKLEMLVSDNGTTWTPHLNYYDAAQTPINAESAYSNVGFGFYWENDPPELVSNIGSSVNEEDTVLIDYTVLEASDVESPDSELYFVFDPRNEALLPLHGKLYLDGTMILPGDSISMNDLRVNNISYVHDGSESTIDSIAFSLTDSAGAKCFINGESVFYFVFTITPVDDSPVVETNSGARIYEDSILILSADELFTTDPESSPEHITYILDPESNSDFPSAGILKLNGIPRGDGDSFTQADINSGKLIYDHDGSPSLEDGFVFRVVDEYNHPAEEDGNTVFFFAISITPVNDAPLLSKNFPLEIDEGGSGIINNSLLAASDEESGPAEISFTLDPDFSVENPLTGNILLSDQVLGDGDSFTMEDVNNSLLTFIHNGDETASDFFTFKVSDPEGGIAHDGDYTIFHFNINIRNINDPPLLENPLPDMESRAEEAFNYTIPAYTFTDPDPGEALSYTAGLIGDQSLPVWLTLDAASGEFSGTPPYEAKGEHLIILTATDHANASAADTFSLEIISPLEIQKGQKDERFTLSPNPFRDRLYLNFDAELNAKKHIYIHNMLGERIYENSSTDLRGLSLDLSLQPAGIYFIQIEFDGQIYTRKLLKE